MERSASQRLGVTLASWKLTPLPTCFIRPDLPFFASDFDMTLKLSTLAVVLGLGMGLPQIYGIVKPAAFAAAVRKFPRSLPWGYALMLLGTAWFLWNLSQ